MELYGYEIQREKDLSHHGILGQKWGKQNGPPYPLDAKDHSASEKKAGWRKSLDNDDWYAQQNKEIIVNKNGSKTVPKGFSFNRVAGEEIKFNSAGGLYVSYGKDDAARYMISLGPTLAGKLLKQYGTHVQHISVTKPIKLASDSVMVKETLKMLDQNEDLYNLFNNSFYSLAFNGDYTKDKMFSRKDLEKALQNPESNKSKQLAYLVISMYGNSAAKDQVKNIYDHFRDLGYDAIPDLYDQWTGAGSTAMIILNKDKIKMTSKTYITKDMMKAGKKYVKKIGFTRMDEILDA